MKHWIPLGLASFCLAPLASAAPHGDRFESFLKPLFAESCVKCHGGEKIKGKVNLKELETAPQLLAKPSLIKEMIEAVEAYDMPPEDGPELDEAVRGQLAAALKSMLAESATAGETKPAQIRRLNRFQYNNAVRDLFALDRDIFHMPEKLMTRHGGYLDLASGKLPDRVEVSCESLRKAGGMRDVVAFPKDLRAAHGYDNQANQLTLSPLLLDSFLKLSVSILDSPDFNPETVGIWNDLFAEPVAGADLPAALRDRLQRFLTKAFRGTVDAATLDRYASYVLTKIEGGMAFTEAMKKAASAALSSPMFLYRFSDAADERERLLALASNLSFFLWGSAPDEGLLRLAASGELADKEVLNGVIARMLADPKVERFLDSFPTQWMQLENVLAATPDPDAHRLFSLDRDNPAGLQMVLEPLLLFDAVFVEDRPIVELVAPEFGYRSELLKDWYTTDLKPEPIDEAKVDEENRIRVERRAAIESSIREARAKLDDLNTSIDDPIAKGLIEVDLAPGRARWETAQAQMVAEGVALGNWHRIGPFGAANFDEAHAKAFIDETSPNRDLSKAHGNLKWQEMPGFADGRVHELSGANCATYLHRSLNSGSDRPLEISLGSDDSFKIWLDGKLVADRKISRGVAPDQDKVRLDLKEGTNRLLMKVANGGGGYGFYFRARSLPLPEPVVAALRVARGGRSVEQDEILARHYLSLAPELAGLREGLTAKRDAASNTLRGFEEELHRAPQPQNLAQHRAEAQRRFDEQLRNKLRARRFERVAVTDARYGGVITNAAMLSMTSGPKRTHPIARGAWIIEVIFNDPPPPPPNDVPPLDEGAGEKNLTIREKFAQHRANPDCAGCHSRLDPLGFALENFDIVGRWRDRYDNGRDVDASGTLMKKYPFDGVIGFKATLAKEERRFAKAFTAHLLRFALSRELQPADSLTVEAIVDKTEDERFRLRSLIREVILSEPFSQLTSPP